MLRILPALGPVLFCAITANAASTTSQGVPSRGVLLDFSATWCMPCQQMNAIVSRLERQGYPIRKVDVDKQPDLARRYNVRSIPAFVLVVDGKEKNRIVGQTTESQLKQLLAQIPREPANPRNLPTQAVAAADPPRGRGAEFNFPFPLGKETATESDSENPPPEEPQTAAVAPAEIPHAEAQDEQPDSREGFDPLPCSTRIRVRDEKGVNYGSGTVIFSEPGRALVLTCGHIFRSLSSKAQIEVDVFASKKVETYSGEIVDFDLEGDVGLMWIHCPQVLPHATVAGDRYSLKVEQPVSSVGCGGGEPPSRQDLQITALNKYLGPANIECTGTPIRGRSGGGLFAETGEVIGVCIAADPKEQRGLYAGLAVVHQMLDRCELSHLYPQTAPAAAGELAQTSAESPFATEPPPTAPVRTASAEPDFAPSSHATATPEALSGGAAEVVCIIRPLNSPRDASRVVIINRASSRFVSYLTGELESQPRPTSAFVPLPKREPPPFSAPESEPIERYRRSR